MIKTLILGGNEKCIFLLKYLEKLPDPFLKIVAVVDEDKNAPGLLYAKQKGIYTSTDYRNFLKNDSDIKFIIELTGKKEIVYDILTRKPAHIAFVDSAAIKLFLDLLTEKERAEEKRIQAEKKMLQIQRYETIGTLISGISHEFNNLLMAIAGYAQLVLMKIDKKSPFYRHISGIVDSCNRASDLISKLLAFGRHAQLEKMKLNLAPLIKETVNLLKRTLPENIIIHLDIAPSVYQVEADPSQIHQIVINLAANARDAMPQGGELYIKLYNIFLDNDYCKRHPYVKPGEYVCLSMRDTGIGIPKEIRERIFDPFFTTKPSGTGMGLSVVYGIIKQHKGCINVYSEENVGTEFKVYLPAIKSTKKHKKSRLFKGHGEGILIIEDEPQILAGTTAFLQELGYKIFQSTDAEEAINLFKINKDKISVVISDMVMPKLSGLELAKEVKQMKPEVKVIIMSGYTISKKTDYIDDILIKPVFFPHLSEMIRKLINPSS